ncbi:alpha/beta fold hydrolase [Microbacterium sp. JZ31]|uniref:alpha/beta fold hydrolase n=1 Tax=Microbacterium sp. JZ31 TaxID=1906274 RepID=UPI001931E9AE|nr:alpha/beta hydrolase [Microbacterium sp. JZ31]
MLPARLLDVDGRTFRVWSSQRGDAKATFVLVHGIGISHRLFSRLHGVLSARHTVHTLDLPGFGGLPKPDDSPDVAEMAAGIATVLGRIGAGPVVAVGNSMGSQWVVELGAQRPDLVSHVVTIGPVADARHRSPLAQATALGADMLREPPTANTRVLMEYARSGVRWYLQQLPHMLSYRIEDRVADLAQPLLVLRGGWDPIAGREWCRRLRDGARRGRMVEVPRHPHLAQHTSPRATAAALEWFLDEEGT